MLQSRRDRSRRALFWARITGLVLVVTVGATLRTEPGLRQALLTAAVDSVVAMRGPAEPERHFAGITPAHSEEGLIRERPQLQDRVKVNRHLGNNLSPGDRDNRAARVGTDQ